ncbi:glycoside hydrolase family 88/105 protein [Mucilaginibacter paludis]|uniref:Glycosyl hydrolase family 88 n=1 Tax=Mucilaginibacter paludis DSM 18603 TaxID=714943 RepID=H1Y5I1_9SPHI|nr:glycoside hydrolase family 88 protein [Mucilaginibacter paludis]EHQ29333.1 glycosyl hydrolase family 88 [Mucilaginibacter paludis DSM 18603]
MKKHLSVSFHTILIMLLLANIAASAKKRYHKPGVNPSDSIYQYMKKVADWQWRDLETNGWKNNQKDWTNGAMYTGMLAWANIAHDDSYYQKLVKVGDDNQWKIGNHRHFADDYCIGQMYAQLYKKYKNPRYIADFKSMADTLVVLPHTEPLLWVNNIHLREWAWCDALFMGPPALAYLSQATGDARYLDKACKLWWKSSGYLYSNDQHLFFRDSRYFTQKEKNGKNVFWSRGNGWVMGGMVNLLSVMPANHPDRAKFIRQFKQMAASIARLQQPDGTWHASLLDPDSYPTKETSGTGFFCYAFAWGINQKILLYNEFYPVVAKAWSALTSAVHADGKLGYVQPQGAAPEKVTADDTEVYGVGAFLLAGTEMLKLKNNALQP